MLEHHFCFQLTSGLFYVFRMSILSRCETRMPSGNTRRRLLILACSDLKKPVDGDVIAWNLYDGVAYKMLEKLQREGQFPLDVDIVILSAKYAMINPEKRIRNYNLRMTYARAIEQRSVNSATLTAILQKATYREVYVHGGAAYKVALPAG
jgi:hypothetical protein